MADATVLKTVGLIIRTGSSPVSGTTRNLTPVERSTGFDFTTAKFTAKLFILPLLGFGWRHQAPIRHLLPSRVFHPAQHSPTPSSFPWRVFAGRCAPLNGRNLLDGCQPLRRKPL